MFNVVDIPPGAADLTEQIGTKEKFWFDNNRRLFKQGRPGTGENWAEVVAAALAAKLGLPHAEYQLATYADQQGVVSPSFVTAGARLVLGNELVGFAGRETDNRQARRVAHTIGRISALLNSPAVAVPEGWNAPRAAFNAADVMSGYLLLDALIGNQDRHEENWGFLVRRGAVYLAPTFDHASSLGRNETDQRRLQKLEARHPDHGVEGYARRAKAPIFDTDGAFSLIGAFRAMARSSPDRGSHWLTRLESVEEQDVRELLGRVPAAWISDPARRFAADLVCVNKRRLLEVP